MIGTVMDALDPIEAVALHDGHPELMPGGADDAAITRGLPDRLAGLDLIEPATRLYDEALQSTPAAERAEIGAKLADLWLAPAMTPAPARRSMPRKPTDCRPPPRRTAPTRGPRRWRGPATRWRPSPPSVTPARADLYWRDSNWDLAAGDYLRAAESQPDDDSAAARKARLILRATSALLLADERTEVAAVKDKYGPALAKSAVATVFDKITVPDAGTEVLALPDVSAEIVKID